MKLLEVEGARAPMPHSWRRHCVCPPPSPVCFVCACASVWSYVGVCVLTAQCAAAAACRCIRSDGWTRLARRLVEVLADVRGRLRRPRGRSVQWCLAGNFRWNVDFATAADRQIHAELQANSVNAQSVTDREMSSNSFVDVSLTNQFSDSQFADKAIRW